MSCSLLMRSGVWVPAILFLVALGAPRAAAEPGGHTIPHPRAKDQRLQISFAPWRCTSCAGHPRAEEEPRTVTLMGVAADELAERIGLRRGWCAIESPHFRLFTTLGGCNVKCSDSRFMRVDLAGLKEIFPKFKPAHHGAHLSAHQRAHLYQLRLERLYAHFGALTANNEQWLGMKAPFHVLLFEDTKQLRAFQEHVLRQPTNRDTVVRHLDDANFLLFATAAELLRGGDRRLNNAVVHHVTHLLVNGHHNYYKNVWAWLEEGCAHYYARCESTQENYFCRGGAPWPKMFVRGDWKARIRHAVQRGKDPCLGFWCEKLHPYELSDLQHGLSWSYVEWLMNTDAVRLAHLLDKSSDHREDLSARQAIEDVFGVTPEVLHERWRAYVREHY